MKTFQHQNFQTYKSDAGMRMKTALSEGKSTDMSRNGDEADIVEEAETLNFQQNIGD